MANVSEHLVPVPPAEPLPIEAHVEEVVAVADEPRALEVAAPARTAAVAASGFVAGVATMAVMHRRSVRKAVRGRKSAGSLLPIVGSRSFLVDVHLIGRD
jgi:hypothetical protein